MNHFRKHLLVLMLGALSVLSFSAAHATPITADIANFSLIHTGSNPAGNGNSDDWLVFDGGQTLDLDFDMTANVLSLIAPQTFSMSSVNGATGVLELLSFDMDLNDADGFSGGLIEYDLNGVQGTFIFADANYTTIYNTSALNNGHFNLYIWGGDGENDLGLDMGISAQVPEPGVLVLFLAGLVALRLSRRSGS